MFSNNNRISLRQTYRLFLFDFLGISTLLLPVQLAGQSGIYGLFSILGGAVLGVLYLCYLSCCVRNMEMGIGEFLDTGITKKCGTVIVTLLVITCVISAAYVSSVTVSLIQHSLIKEESYILILLLLLVVAGYAICGGIESRARVYEVMFWVILIPLFLMLFFSLKGFDGTFFQTPIAWRPLSVLKGSYQVFLSMLTMFFLLFFPEYLPDAVKEKGMKRAVQKQMYAAAFAFGCAIAILAVIYVILLGTFGEAALAHMKYPVVTLMSTIQIAGGFVKRLDAIMLAVWFFTLFALLNLHLYYATKMLKRTINREGNKRYVAAVLFLTFLLSLAIGTWEGVECFCKEVIFWGIGPIYILLPGVLLLLGRRQKKKAKPKIRGKLLILTLFLLTELCGCSVTEVEERCFPMLTAVDYESEEKTVGFTYVFPMLKVEPDAATVAMDETEEMVYEKTVLGAWKNYEKRLNKSPDYNHMKIFVMSTSFLEEQKQYELLLEKIRDEETYPRNTYVIATEDIGKLLAWKDELNTDLGTYIEQMIENREAEKKYNLPTLGSLIDELSNHRKIWDIPYMNIEKDTLVWSSFYRMEKGEPAGVITVDDLP